MRSWFERGGEGGICIYINYWFIYELILFLCNTFFELSFEFNLPKTLFSHLVFSISMLYSSVSLNLFDSYTYLNTDLHILAWDWIFNLLPLSIIILNGNRRLSND
eukprot:105942_1